MFFVINAALFLSSAATLVLAQGQSGLPKCAQQCVGNSLSSTGCQTTDVKCICNSSGYIQGLSCCVSGQCSPADIQSTINFANQICGLQGVTNLPKSATCPSSSGASSFDLSTVSLPYHSFSSYTGPGPHPLVTAGSTSVNSNQPSAAPVTPSGGDMSAPSRSYESGAANNPSTAKQSPSITPTSASSFPTSSAMLISSSLPETETADIPHNSGSASMMSSSNAMPTGSGSATGMIMNSNSTATTGAVGSGNTGNAGGSTGSGSSARPASTGAARRDFVGIGAAVLAGMAGIGALML